ncbi:MAG: glycerate kinase [Ignavibacteriales bacterium]|nr:glycerate kinase [Ignavibacteriales bacterium]
MPTKIVIAPDSFKGSLTAHEAASAMEQGVLQLLPDAHILKHPVSDGGEGLVGVVTSALGGCIVTTNVSGPLPGQRVDARWGLSSDGSFAIIEMAEAAGLTLVPADRRDPKITTTYGVGELIRAALDAGVSSIVIGIGGSATNDGGAGMAEALGVRFVDASGKALGRGGAALLDIAAIDTQGKDVRIDNVEVLVACDVQNTLCGIQGASAVYGPQKGARLSDVSLLDKALLRFGKSVHASLGVDVLDVAGGGAAGGLGAGLVAFCGATLKRGIDVVLQVTGFDDHLQGADLVITGEGRIDRQVRFGKAISGVVEQAKRHNIPVAAVVGSIEGSRESFLNDGFLNDLEPLVDVHTSSEEAMRNAQTLIVERTKLLIQRYLNRKYNN